MQPRFNPAEVILPEGAKLGSYVVKSPIARGGMAAVYRAEHSWSGHQVALKCVKLPRETDAGTRFRREAIALAQTNGEHLVHYFDGNEADGGVMWIAMELMASDLRDEIYTHWRTEGTGLPIERVLEVVESVAKGLKSLHSQRILHRDIKPENIGFTDDGVVKILDFGLVKFLDRIFQTTDVRLTPGTPAYMAPEQITGEELGPETDIYALGITLYEMLAGLHPFATDEHNRLPANIALQQQTRDLPAIPEVPKPLFRLIQGMTEKSKTSRISSANALLNELAQVRRTSSVRRSPRRALVGKPGRYDGTKPGVNESKLIMLRSFAVGGALAAAGVLAIVSLPRTQQQQSAVAAPQSKRGQQQATTDLEPVPSSRPANSDVEPRNPPSTPAGAAEAPLPLVKTPHVEPRVSEARQRRRSSRDDSSPNGSSTAIRQESANEEYPWPTFDGKSTEKGKKKRPPSEDAEPIFILE